MNEEEKETKKWSLRKKLVIGAGVGLMIVPLLFVGVIVGGALGLLRGDRGHTMTRVWADFSAIEAALVMYESKSQRLPTTEQGLKALVEKPTTVPIPRNWGMQMRQVPHDPWGTEYGYRHVAELRRFLLISAGPDRQFDTEDDLTSNTE